MSNRRTLALYACAAAFIAVGQGARGNDQPATAASAALEDEFYALLAPRAESPGVWELSVGADYSTGFYGAPRATNVYFAPVGIAYRDGRWRFGVDSGVLRVKGPVDYAAILDLTDDEVESIGLRDDSVAHGLADTSVSATYGIYENFAALLFVDVGVRIKIPTAGRSKGLGNGRFAGDLQVDAVKMMGAWSVLASASYGVRHHEGNGRDGISGSIGLGKALSPATSLGAIYEWRRSIDPRARNGQDVIAYLSHRFSDRVALTAYGVRSLLPSGVRAEVGTRVTYRWP